MKLTAGKYYRIRNGTKVLLHDNECEEFPFYHDSGFGEDGFHGVTEDGLSCIQDDDCDIVGEWVEYDSELRDTIAQQAMVAIISKYKKENTPEWSAAVAKSAFMYADAFLEARGK